MELINNVKKTLRDDLMKQLKAGSRLSIAASCFSIFRQIEALEKRCRSEKQTRKRYELHQPIVKLKEQLVK